MDASTAAEQLRLKSLRTAYDEAFREFSLRVRRLQALVSHSVPNGAGIGEAQGLLERAQAVYRETRDELAEFILERSAWLEGRRFAPAPRETEHSPGGGQAAAAPAESTE